MKSAFCFLLLIASPAVFAQPSHPGAVAAISNGSMTLEFNEKLWTRLSASGNSDFRPTETLTIEGPTLLQNFKYVEHRLADHGNRLVIAGKAGGLLKTVTVWRSKDFPGAFLFSVRYTNQSRHSIQIQSYRNNHYVIPTSSSELWSFQPGSYTSRPDWLQKIEPGFSQQNFMGMNDTDFGGGTPVTAIWSAKQGLAVGSRELTPREIALPVTYSNPGQAELSVDLEQNQILRRNQSLWTVKTFVAPFRRDVFQTLRNYSLYMQKRGLKMAHSPHAEVGPIWCAWGYGRNFTVSQVIDSLPLVKKLGFEWVGIDDGWQTAIGDWTPNPIKFPAGDADMKRLVDAIHSHGLKAQLWWAPLAAHQSSLHVRNHPETLLRNLDGTPRDITFWDAWSLCPTVPSVRAQVKDLARKFIADWGFDGLKIDGQHLNSSAPCHNKAHNHQKASESYQSHPQIFREIFQATTQAKSSALIETCPCGTAYSIYNLPYQNMTVASDPESSLQVRQKGKILRALTGDQVVFFGDHVELSNEGTDFASTIGIGGLVGSNFTRPELVTEPPMADEKPSGLTPDRLSIWKKWLPIAKSKRLWNGEYLGGLYDIGFDKPETHVVRQGRTLHYGFYADRFRGDIEFRGLRAGKSYQIFDYVENKKLGTVVGPTGRLNTQFEKYLLVEAQPLE